MPIHGLEEPTALVFHAGTKSSEGRVVTSGGRVLAITGEGNTIKEALQKAYEQVARISWDDAYFRRDIGQDLL